MSKESPPVREVVPFKPGKRQSTFRKLNLDFAGTALEEALARQQQQEEGGQETEVAESTPLTPVTGVRGVDSAKESSNNVVATEAATPLTPVTGVRGVAAKKRLTPVTGVNQEAAPRKDFTRAANSIVRDAIPAGVFTGKGKHLYDYLYSQTRGAIIPVHAARIPTEKVMAGAGMTRNTFRFHLERLCNSGLIKVDQRPGEHGGNVYTVLLPEEAGLQRGDRGERGERGENLPLVQGSEVDPSHPGSTLAESDTYGGSKTLIKTIEENTDDEAFADLNDLLRQASADLTGKSPKAADRERWREIAEILVTELRIAAGRTTVSSVPAFLAEHLRRRLWKIDKRQALAEGRELPGQPAESETTPPNVRECPDCGGTGWWYPQGQERGVSKCRHSKLADVPHAQ